MQNPLFNTYVNFVALTAAVLNEIDYKYLTLLKDFILKQRKNYSYLTFKQLLKQIYQRN